jgi:hypothetical protein
MNILRAFELYVYDDLARTPGEHDLSPLERMDAAIAKYGVMGINQAYNDDFLIKTSVDVKFTGRATEKRGIKISGGIYTSQALSLLLRTAQPDEVRLDCEDPAVLYAKIGLGWVKAFKNNILTIASLNPAEKLFELLWAPDARRNRSDRKQDVDRDVYNRNQTIAASTGQPAVTGESPTAPDDVLDSEADEDTCASDTSVPTWDEIMPLAAE